MKLKKRPIFLEITKNSFFGQIDTAGFPKDSFYAYQAEWTDYKLKPMVHLLPYWDFNEGQLIDVMVTSNAPKVELFFQDKSMEALILTTKMEKNCLPDGRFLMNKEHCVPSLMTKMGP